MYAALYKMSFVISLNLTIFFMQSHICSVSDHDLRNLIPLGFLVQLAVIKEMIHTP